MFPREAIGQPVAYGLLRLSEPKVAEWISMSSPAERPRQRKGAIPRALGWLALGALGVGGTCSESPPYHDLSGSWVNDSWGAPTVELEGRDALEVDVDLAMAITAAVPQDRTPLPVEGAVCVSEHAGLGLAGRYVLDPAASTWAGADYGGARLDLVARAADGRRLSIAQAFMHNASPDALGNAILGFTTAAGAPAGVIRFEGFRRSTEGTCP